MFKFLGWVVIVFFLMAISVQLDDINSGVKGVNAFFSLLQEPPQ